MKRIAAFIVRYRYYILTIIFAFTVLCGYWIPKVNVNSDMTAYLPDSSAMKQGIDVMAREFSDLTQPNTLRLMVDDLDGSEKERMHLQLAAVENVTSVQYDPDDSDFNRDNHTLYVISTPLAAGSQEEDGLKQTIEEIAAGHDYLLEQNDEKVVLTPRLAIIAVLLVVVILTLMSESWFEPILFLFVIGVSIVLNMGTNIFKPTVSETTFSIASILQLVLSMDYSIILSSRYRQELRRTQSRREAMQHALVNAFSSVSSSAMTTFIGLLMLLFISFKIAPDLGIVLAKGVLCSLVCVMTVLPALLIAFTGVIRKTEKRMLKMPSGAAARFIMKMRVPLTVLFAVLFAAAFFFQTKTGITFSTSTQNGIKEIFPADNTMIVLYDNQDEQSLENIVDAVESDALVRSAVSYPTLIGKQSTAEELHKEISDMSGEFPLETWMLRLLYYKNHTGGKLPAVKAADLLQFVADEVVPNEYFSAYLDADIKDQVSMIRKFADKRTLTKKMTVQELADFFGIEQEKVQQMLVLYYTDVQDAAVTEITLSAFVGFLQRDILSDKTYAAMADETMRAQIDRLQTFTDREAVTTPLTSSEMAAFLGASESEIRAAYLKYNGLFRAGDKISACDFLQFMTTDVTIAGRLDEETAEQMSTLARILEKVVSEETCGYAEISEIMGMDLSQARQILLLYTSKYGDTSAWQLTPQSFVRFLVRDVMSESAYASMIDAEYKAYLTAADALAQAVVSDRACSADELLQLLSGLSDKLDADTLNLLLTYYGSVRLYDTGYTMSLEQLYRFLEENILQDPVWQNLLDVSARTQFSEMGETLTQAVNALKRENHSLLQITTKYPGESDETMRFVDTLHNLCAKHLAHNYYVIGESQMYYEMKQDFHREMLLLTILTAVSVFLVVLLSFRNGLIPLLLVSIVQCGVYVAMAVCYFMGDSINYLAYLIVQCLLMGASIDYGILLTNYYRELRKTEDVRTALAHAYGNCMHTILTSGSIMTGVAAVIGFASVDPMIGSILRVLAIGSLSAIVLILFVLPGMLVVFDRWIVPRKKNK